MSRTVTGIFPQKLQALQIIAIGTKDAKTKQTKCILIDGREVNTSELQTNAFQPTVGDYYVVPSEGYPYFAAKATFAQTFTVSS
jgi:hypothetical protein